MVRRPSRSTRWPDTGVFGSRNDGEMLRWAARGGAMGHADDVVQAAADEVTGTIEDDGAARVLQSLLPAT